MANINITPISESRIRVKTSGSQVIPTSSWTKIMLNVEDYDSQSEFNSSVIASTATSTSADHLVDSTAPFVAGDVGKTVWNTTDNTYATITVFNSTSDVTLSADIMANTETYNAYFSKFITSATGYYSLSMTGNFSSLPDGKKGGLAYKVDGTFINYNYSISPATLDFWSYLNDIIYLTAGQILDFWAYQNSGGNLNLIGGANTTYIAIHKLS